jgi:DNA polymerase V
LINKAGTKDSVNKQLDTVMSKDPTVIRLNEDSSAVSGIGFSKLFPMNTEKSFLIRVAGDSMINAGIKSGDIVVVDTAMDAENGKIVIASINQKIVVKRIKYNPKDGVTLYPENSKYPDIKINRGDKFKVWGVVTAVIKNLI